MNTTQQYKMLSDEALAKFKIFCAAGKLPSPKGAFDAARRRSNVMAYDAAGEDPNEIPHQILELLAGKLSDDDLRTVKELLMIEAGEELPVMKEAKQMAKASASRAGAQDSAVSFDRLYPSAKKIGRDPLFHFR